MIAHTDGRPLRTDHILDNVMKKKSKIAHISLLTMGLAVSASSLACTDPSYTLLGSVCMTAATFCPRGYAEASGQLMPIDQNQPLFSLLETTYGGDGRTNFALPNLNGRFPVGIGTDPQGATYWLGQVGGVSSQTLTAAQLPPHTHLATGTVTGTVTLNAASSGGTASAPAGQYLADSRRSAIYAGGTPDAALGTGAATFAGTATVTVAPAGNGQSVDNRPPYLGLRFCIAIQGLYPSQY